MKKFFACLTIILTALSCDKEVSPVCGCSPVESSFSLIIKNQQNKDLLDSTVAGAFDKKAIKILYRKNTELKEAYSRIFPPVHGTADPMPYHHIYSEMARLSMSAHVKEFYIDFGNGDKDTITIDSYNSATAEPLNLKVNNVALAKEPIESTQHSFYVLVK